MSYDELTTYAKFEGPFTIEDPAVSARLKAFLKSRQIFFAKISKTHSTLHCLFQFFTVGARKRCIVRNYQECFVGASLQLIASPIKSPDQISACWNCKEFLFEYGNFKAISSLHISAANSAMIPSPDRGRPSGACLVPGHAQAPLLRADKQPVANCFADSAGSNSLAQSSPHDSRDCFVGSALVIAARRCPYPPALSFNPAPRGSGADSHPCPSAHASAAAIISITASGKKLEPSKACLLQTSPFSDLQGGDLSMQEKEPVFDDVSRGADSSGKRESSVATRVAERTGRGLNDAEEIAKSLSNVGIASLERLGLLKQDELKETCQGISSFEAENILLDDCDWELEWFRRMIISEGPAERQSMANNGHLSSKALKQAGISEKEHLLRLSDQDMDAMGFPVALKIFVRQKRGVVSPELRAVGYGQLSGSELGQVHDVDAYDADHPPCETAGSEVNDNDFHGKDLKVAAPVMDLGDTLAAPAALIMAEVAPPDSSWLDLYKTASKFFHGSGSDPLGTAGTLKPKHQIRVLQAGLQALKSGHHYKQGENLGLIDLGCGPGHVLVCGALSGIFSACRGIDFKENENSLHGQFQLFLQKIEPQPRLASVKAKIRDVKFFWADAETSYKTISQVFGISFESIQMVYWFASGWDARDIPKAAQMLARSEEVRVIVCVGLRNAVGAHAKTVLEHLNSEKGFQFFFLKEQVQAGSFQMPVSGDQSNHTAYILARLQQHDELKYPVWPFPQTQQSVEVLFDDAKWHGGCVCAFNPQDSKGIIRCHDAEILEFDSGDPDISFLPRTDLQWLFGSSSFGSGSSRVLSPFSSNCTLCSSAVAHEEKIQCARCSVNIFHARCIGSSTMPMDLENFLCVFCRSDLADSGRRQNPCFFWDPANMFCAGCGYAIQGSDQNEFDYCKICNAVYGYCCSARTSAAKKFEFRCCGCIGRKAHDSHLSVIFRVVSMEIADMCEEKKKPSPGDILLQDEFARAVTALQQQCLFDHLKENIDTLLTLTKMQLQHACNPSLGLMDALKLIQMHKGFTWQIYQDLSIRHAEILHKCAGLSEPIPNQAVQNSVMHVGAKKKLAFVTADLRLTPWWSLMKVFLLWIAGHYDLFMISMPEVEDILDDPYYKALCKLATIIEFPAETPHRAIADRIQSLRVDVLIDGGGPTAGSLTGVLVYRPTLLQLAFLGFPGTQNGQHIDGTIADQFVLVGRQLSSATERIIFLPSCYQPNSAFSLPVHVNFRSPMVSKPTRKKMGIPDGKFVFCFFGELGRLSQDLIKTYANILRRCPDSVLWLRQFPRLAYPRTVAQFVNCYADAEERIIPAPDVPNEEHMARLQCANLSLDSDLYSMHTSASDCLKNGVLFLALNLRNKGDLFHRRVSSCLVKAAMGSEELIASSLDEVEKIAVTLASNSTYYNRQCQTLRTSIQNREGLFDVEEYVSGFVRGVDEMWRQKNANLPLQDVYTSPPTTAPTGRGAWTVVLPESCTMDSPQERAAKRKSVHMTDSSRLAEAESTRNVVCKTLSDSAALARFNVVSDAGADCGTRHDPELQAIYALAKTDSNGARLLAKKYIEKNIPEGRKIHIIKLENGQQLLAIQLPFDSRIKRFSTGSITGTERLPLLYLAEGKYGVHLYMGQHTTKDTILTAYDGAVVDSSSVRDFRWVISLQYKTLCVDGKQVKMEVQVEKGSLGCFSNHKEQKSLAKFRHRDVISPVSGHSKSIHLQAKRPAEQHEEVTSYYTPGSARRHDIPRAFNVAGCNDITDDQLAAAGLSKLVVSGMHLLREQGGYDLLDVLGKGGFGGVLKIRFRESVFAVKLGSTPYSKSVRHDVLVEAAVMGLAARGSNQFSLMLHKSAGWSSGAALLKSGSDRIAAVAMQCADSSSHALWCTMGERFRAGDQQLFPDLRSVLKATTQVVAWAHEQQLVHGDLHAGNVFLIRLAEHCTLRSGMATCCVRGQLYQVLLGDWGLARWSSYTDVAHRFTDGVSGRHHPPIKGLEQEVAGAIFPVSVNDLNVSFGLLRKSPAEFPHPGGGSYLIRAPHCKSWNQVSELEVLDSSRKQRYFDQAGDAWALGVLAARVIAPRPLKEQDKEQSGHKFWAQKLQTASKNARTTDTRSHNASSRAKRALDSIQADSGEVKPWIIDFCRDLNSGKTWDPLFQRLNGSEAEHWNLLLDLLQGQLTFSSQQRMTPMRSLEHAFFSNTPAEL